MAGSGVRFKHIRILKIIGFLFWFTGTFVNGHPQCLDSRPPFQSFGIKLSFCTDYEHYGCCTVNDDMVLQNRFDAIRSLIPATKQYMWNTCAHYAKTFLCQTCSPYAAHIFDSEVSTYGSLPEPRAFPGLCRSYCGTFYQNCRELVMYYMDEAGVRYASEAARLSTAITVSETEFCTATKILDLDYCFPDLLTNNVLNGNISIEKITQEGCLCMEPFAKEFRNPIFLKHANDGSKRMFIGEQIGLVHIMYPDGTVLPEPFVDIRPDIKTTVSKGDERGMLGMEFHPNFLQNRKFYIYYSTPLNAYEKYQELGNHKTRIEELKVLVDNPNQVDYNYSRIIMEVYEPYWNHNGGEILFGDDGYMYLFIGDGGGAGDPLSSGQDLFSMLGKVHRIDVDHVDVVRQTEYSIPPDNPYADGVNGLPEIYAYGVRNIWRCGKDRGDPITKEGKGRIVCGDVGQSAREEINLIEKGANYGWKIREGSIEYCPYCNRSEPEKNLTEPIWDYPHSVGKSVTGGNFYRGCHNPNLNGYYIYGDFMNGKLFRLLHDPATNTWNNKQLKMCGSDYCKPPLTNDYSTSIISFGEDEAGEVYMLSTSYASTTVYQGTVYRIVDPVRRGNPADCDPDYHATTPAGTTTSAATTAGTTTTLKPVSAATTAAFTSAPAVTRLPLLDLSVTTTKSNYVSVSYQSILELIRRWLTRNSVSEPGRMVDYLEYYKRKSLRNRRRKMQKEFTEERARKKQHLVTYRATPPVQNPTSAPSTLKLHGINFQRCTTTPSFWCSLSRLILGRPRK